MDTSCSRILWQADWNSQGLNHQPPELKLLKMIFSNDVLFVAIATYWSWHKKMACFLYWLSKKNAVEISVIARRQEAMNSVRLCWTGQVLYLCNVSCTPGSGTFLQSQRTLLETWKTKANHKAGIIGKGYKNCPHMMTCDDVWWKSLLLLWRRGERLLERHFWAFLHAQSDRFWTSPVM